MKLTRKEKTMLRKCRRTPLIGIYAATVLVVALVAAGCGGDSSSSTSTGAQASGVPAKTVLVFDREPSPSHSPTHLRTGLLKGQLPDGPVQATVLTDENCAPDRQGISHCRNAVRLAGGGIVVLRHPHEMHHVPCLEPGETVLLRRA
jgi:hypothetical protein